MSEPKTPEELIFCPQELTQPKSPDMVKCEQPKQIDYMDKGQLDRLLDELDSFRDAVRTTAKSLDMNDDQSQVFTQITIGGSLKKSLENFKINPHTGIRKGTVRNLAKSLENKLSGSLGSINKLSQPPVETLPRSPLSVSPPVEVQDKRNQEKSVEKPVLGKKRSRDNAEMRQKTNSPSPPPFQPMPSKITERKKNTFFLKNL